MAALLLGCTEDGAGEVRVDRADHDSFFLWAGVGAPPELDHARQVYILSGEVRASDPAKIVPLRAATPRVEHAQIWLTIRTERLDWDERVYRQLLGDLARWEANGNSLEGLQVDFDAATLGLDHYGEFLADLRARLPARFKLSITGLMDWSANGDIADLARLSGIIDEAVIQTYQGRETISGYERYLGALSRLGMPYRVGLVENGGWREPPGLRADPHFRGYVVFLVNPEARPPRGLFPDQPLSGSLPR